MPARTVGASKPGNYSVMLVEYEHGGVMARRYSTAVFETEYLRAQHTERVMRRLVSAYLSEATETNAQGLDFGTEFPYAYVASLARPSTRPFGEAYTAALTLADLETVFTHFVNMPVRKYALINLTQEGFVNTTPSLSPGLS